MITGIYFNMGKDYYIPTNTEHDVILRDDTGIVVEGENMSLVFTSFEEMERLVETLTQAINNAKTHKLYIPNNGD